VNCGGRYQAISDLTDREALAWVVPQEVLEGSWWPDWADDPSSA
jgi:hypothetical protein